MRTLAAVLCCTALFTSCQKPNASEENKPDNTPAFVEVTLSCPATQDMLTNTDMVIFYNDGTGEKTETVSALDWSKTMKIALPCTVSFGRTVALKSGVEMTKDVHFSYSTGFLVSYKILNASDVQLGRGTSGATNNANFTADKVALLINDGKLNETHSYSFDKNGAVK